MDTKDWLPWVGISITILGAMLHANARFVKLETKIDLMYESFKQGILQPWAIRGVSGGKRDGN